MMIHNPWGGAIGDAKEMRRMADLLDSVRGTLVSTYAARTGNSKEKIVAWMDDETWMPADDAKKYGFADHVTEPVKAAARVTVTKPEIYKNLPAAFRPNRAIAARAAASIAEYRNRKPGL